MNSRILVIRGGAIGDFILTLPALKLLRENFREAHLEILGYKHIIALADGRFYADATRSIEYGGLSRFFVPGADLPEDLVEYFASFHQIISYLYDPDGFFETNLRRSGVRHFLHGSPKLDDSAHAVQQLALPLERLALFLDEKTPLLFPKARDLAFADSFLSGRRPGRGLLIAIHPGSGSETKNWPVECWAELGEALFRQEPGASVLLVGGEADGERLRHLRDAWAAHPVQLAENLPLPELAALFHRVDLFLGHDSGISHIAAAAGAPCLLLFGPTDPEIWGPLSADTRIMRAPEERLERLSVEMVAAALAEILRKLRAG